MNSHERKINDWLAKKPLVTFGMSNADLALVNRGPFTPLIIADHLTLSREISLEEMIPRRFRLVVKSDSIVDLMYNAAIHIYRLGSAADMACAIMQSLLL